MAKTESVGYISQIIGKCAWKIGAVTMLALAFSFFFNFINIMRVSFLGLNRWRTTCSREKPLPLTAELPPPASGVALEISSAPAMIPPPAVCVLFL